MTVGDQLIGEARQIIVKRGIVCMWIPIQYGDLQILSFEIRDLTGFRTLFYVTGFRSS